MALQRLPCDAGTFTLPPATAQVSIQPEVNGASAGGTFVVCASATCTDSEVAAGEAGATSAPPSACPEDCNGAGTCAVDTGVCDCFLGFSGPACEVAAGGE